MARQRSSLIESNFSGGLYTEDTGLNFPENHVAETWNNYHETNGQVRRRLGIDIELGTTPESAQPYDSNSGVVVEYLWKAVASSGAFTFLVLQIGDSVSFFELSSNAALINAQKNFAIDLKDYAVGGRLNQYYCSFAAGQGKLFITHPSCDPIVCSYDDVTDTLTQESITIRIRDFEGLDDGLEIDERPSTLSYEHLYNLMNQGWYKNVSMVEQGGGAAEQLDFDELQEEDIDLSSLL